MKIVYMEQTLGLIAKIDPTLVNQIIESGKVKKTESGINYLVIEQDGNTNTESN